MGLFNRKKTEPTGSQMMLANVQEDETRIALTENGLLVDLHIEQNSRERTVGNIYKGVVVKVNPAFQAAFIEYGEDRNGFLSISDVDPSLYKGGAGGQHGRPKIQSVLKTGQTLTVQVLKERIREKGAALTTSISLPGRYLVLTAHSDRSGVSRRIGDPDKRGQLKDVLAGLMGDDKKGVIIRTAGIDRKPAELKRDLANLQKEWKAIEGRFDKQKKPGLLYQEPKSILRVLRDYFSEEVSEVWADSAEAYQEALTYIKAVLPRFQKRLKLYVGEKSLFSAYNIEEQIAALESSKVPLKSGGGLVIEPTEALVSIDVNSGKSKGASDIEETALNTNLEAAREVARQLRLRNLGGLIVIDFIDMVPQKNRDRVEQTLAEAMKNDKARISIGKVSEFGLLELSRQRIDVELSRGLRTQCAACGGTGHVPTVQSGANNVLREIRAMAVTGRYHEIHGELPLEHANFLLNHHRESLRDLELEFEIAINLSGNPALPAGHAVRLEGSVAPTDGDEAGGETAAPEPRKTAAPEPRETAAPEPRETAAPDTDESAAADEGEGGGRPRRRRRRRGRRGEPRPAETHPDQSGAASEPLAAAAEDEEEQAQPLAAAQADADEAPLAAAQADEDEEHDAGEPTRASGRGNGAGMPGRGESEPVQVPATPSLASARRGGWLSEVDSSGTAVGDTLFSSAHQPAEEGGLPVVLPSFKSSSPFTGIDAEDSTTLFVSSHRGEAGAAAASGAEPGNAKTDRKRGPAKSGGKRSRSASGSKSGAGGARAKSGKAKKAE